MQLRLETLKSLYNSLRPVNRFGVFVYMDKYQVSPKEMQMSLKPERDEWSGFFFPPDVSVIRLLQKARKRDDLGPCKLSLTHLLKPSHLSQRRKTHQEIIQLPPLFVPLALDSSSFFLSHIILKQVSTLYPCHVSHHPPRLRCVFGIREPHRASRLGGRPIWNMCVFWFSGDWIRQKVDAGTSPLT